MRALDHARIKGALTRLDGTGDTVPPDARRAALALLLRGETIEDAELLMMRRAHREGDRWSGQIALPGGHEEESDPSLEHTARRESREEVGVDPGADDGYCFGALPPSQAGARGVRLPLYCVPYVFYRASPPAPDLGPEASEAFWFPLAPAMAGDLAATHRYEREGVIHKLPAWEFEGRTVWGMTYSILKRFVDALNTPES